MKAILKLAACGILTLGFFANAAELAGNIGEAVQGNQYARQWVLEELGIQAGAKTADIEMAIRNSTYTAEEKALITNRLNQFANKYATAKTLKDKAATSQLAKDLFTTQQNGKTVMLAVATFAKNNVSRASVTEYAPSCSPDGYAQELFDKHHGKSTLAEIQNAIKSGAIVMGKCHDGQGEMALEDEPFDNLIAMANKVTVNCGKGATGAALENCWLQAQKDVLGIEDFAQGKKNLAAVDQNCGFRGARLN